MSFAEEKSANKKKQNKLIAKSLFKFVGEENHELSFAAGESIAFLKRVDDNWIEGELNGCIGIFPANRVCVQLNDPSELPADLGGNPSGRRFGVAMRDFPGECPGDLPLSQGQIVEVLGVINNSGWTRGKFDKVIGIFPSTFIELIEIGAPKPTPKPRLTTADNKHRPVPKPRTGATRKAEETTERSTNGIANINEQSDMVKSTNHEESDQVDMSNVESLEIHLKKLKSSLDEVEKMITGAESLLSICTDSNKREKLEQTLASQYEVFDSLTQSIETAEAQKDQLELNLPESSTNDKKSKRLKIVAEFITTEEDYCNEITAMCNKILPSFKEWEDVQWIELFSNIEEVANLSEKFCSALKEDRDNLGVVFTTFAPQLKQVYGTYCQNQESASQLLEKLCEDTNIASKIKQLMFLGKPEVNSWDLHTFLIKPVQRVLKYPLLLDKLLQNTPPDSDQHNDLTAAVKLSSQVAQDINELKRRKDILERYTGSGRDERRINFGTMRKKVRRMRQALTQKTGLRSGTVDQKYDTEENQVLTLEAALRTFQFNIISFIDEGNKLFSTRDGLLDSLKDYGGSSSNVTSCVSLYSEMKKKWNRHCVAVQDSVINPVSTLIGLFHDPLLLMNKRGDKLLDYDSLQYDLEKCNEPEKIQQLKESVKTAKRTYEALNAQLLEELPKFLDRVKIALNILISTYISKEIEYHEQMHSILSSTVSELTLSTSTIIKTHLNSLQAVLKEMQMLGIVPSSFAVSFGIVNSTNPPIRTPPIKSRTSLKKSTVKSAGSSPRTSVDNVTRPLPRPRRSQSMQIHPQYEIPNSNTTASSPNDSLVRSHSPIYEEIPDITTRKLTHQSVSMDDIINESPHPLQYDGMYSFSLNCSYNQLPLLGLDSPNDDSDEHEYMIPPDAILSSPDDTEDIIPIGTVLIAIYDFVSETLTELSVDEGDQLVLLCRHDADNCSDWWLVHYVDDEKRKGYVPRNYLKLRYN